MRDISCLARVEELENINRYAKEVLTNDERKLIEKINKIVEDFANERSSSFIEHFNDLTEVQLIWRKYEHLRPFLFQFDPEKKMPKVFNNRIAFIIWTAWRARHLLGEDDDLKGGSLAAAEILSKHQPPFSAEIKETVVKEFQRKKGGSWKEEKKELEFWEQCIFPFLERKWEFKWELKEED